MRNRREIDRSTQKLAKSIWLTENPNKPFDRFAVKKLKEKMLAECTPLMKV